MRSVLVAVTVALVAVSTASAHVDVSPGLLESGEEVELRVELPELRPEAAPTAVEVSGEGLAEGMTVGMPA